jgi:DNA primase
VNSPAGPSDRDRVLDATDIVALIGESVQLRPKGREHVGLCPFHNDRTPSLAVVSHKGSGFYKCFACGAAGNAIDFMINYHRMDFPEALRHLAQRAGIELHSGPRASSGGDDRADSPSSLRRANEAAQRFFRRSLESDAGAAARGIIAGRGISAEMSERFGLGVAPAGGDALVQYVDRLARHSAAGRGRDGGPASRLADGAHGADDRPADEATVRGAFEAAGLVRHRGGHLADGFRNRITFPICDELGRVIAFGARKIDPEDEPKYLNSPESAIFHKSRALYALHLAKRAIVDSRTAIVVEGYTDVIACHAAGLTNVVATLGTSLTRDHARILQRLCDTVVLLFDGDDAGQRAADRALEVFFSATIDVRICTLPDALDPDDLLRQPGGIERFRAAVDASPDALAHLVSRFAAALAERQGVTPRQRAIEAMLQRLAGMGLGELAPLRRRLVLEAIARAAGLPLAEIERAVPAVRARRADGEHERGASPAHDDHGSRSPHVAAESGSYGDDASSYGRDDAGHAAPRARAPLPRALVEAESTLVGLVLAWPECAGVRVASMEGDALPVTELFGPDAMQDAAAGSVWSAIHARLDEGARLPIAEAIALCPDADSKRTATELLMLGQARCPEAADAPARVSEAARDLDRVRMRATAPAHAPATTPEQLAARLQSIRQGGPRTGLIRRTARSSA